MGALVALWVAILLWLLCVSLGGVSQADINAACSEHRGVASYTDHSWSTTDGTGTAVCRDGVAVKVGR